MKDIFKFIFTFSWVENVINKNKKEMITFIIIFSLFYTTTSFLSKIYDPFFNIFWIEINYFSMFIKNSIEIIPLILWAWIANVIIFWLLHKKKNFLECIYFWAVPSFTIIFIYIISIISNILNIDISNNFILIKSIFYIWGAILYIILMKKITWNLFNTILWIIAWSFIYNILIEIINKSL